MRVLLAAPRAALLAALLAPLLAAVALAGCANAAPQARPAGTTAASTIPASTTAAGTTAARVTAASAPFYLTGWPGTGPLAVSVVDGFTGRTVAAIAVPKDAKAFPWMGGHRTWYPCGAVPDDRTFLLCDTDQYYQVRLGDNGKPRPLSAPADIPAAARNDGSNGDPEFAVSPDARLAAVTTATGGIMVVSLVTGATRSWTIPATDGYATSLSWAGDRYVAFAFWPQHRDGGAGGVRVLDTRSTATAALAASRLVISNEAKQAGGISGVFNPVITPDGSKVVAAAWTGSYIAELAEFSARTGRLTAVLMPPAPMPGHGSPCQVLWTDPSGSHLITYCVNSGVVTGTRLTPVHLYVPDTSGTDFNGLVLW